MSVFSYALMLHHLVTEMSIAVSLSVSKWNRHDLIGNAVPKNFTWDDLLNFVPRGENRSLRLLRSIRAGGNTDQSV
jgi:hypothetical protein